ncbi:Annexin, partial [Cenococcum geophilum 1.58]|uniref:Annexin n=1 Tax=Cenococcum geophilum 1.58 TaxID=794803 RepID=UPI00358E8DB8
MTDISSSKTHADPQLSSVAPFGGSSPFAFSNGSPALDNTIDEEESSTIKCICGFPDDDGNTVLCETCDTWQHIVCYYESTEHEPDIHKCADCSPRPVDAKRAAELQRQLWTRIEIYVEALASALVQLVSDLQVFTDILPPLPHEQVLKLRDAYKLRVRFQGKGINLAEHIKLKVSGNFGKVCYVTTLGRWESEAYWANCWHQSGSSPRELLIEALIGKKNHEIREIKAAFRDKRYGDSLETFLERELKADKFQAALLMVLGDSRQEETDVWPCMSIENDTDVLHNALNTSQGGETAMLNVVLKRSDTHLREVLRQYESQYNDSFARAALKKSNNIVGEVIAHVLNGVINKSARDALLIDHALREFSSKETALSSLDEVNEPRYELLISRLVRLHWDQAHMLRVKESYYARYQRSMEEDIKNATGGDFSAFCLSL